MSTATTEENKKAKFDKDKKDELLLDSLEIKGYRCFEHLTIEKLGRVNLIVGKNNVGKTALLEALEIYGTYGSSHDIYDSLISRKESPDIQKHDFEDLRYFSAIRYILPGRPYIKNDISFSIGKNQDEKSKITFTISPPASSPNISFDNTPHKQNLSVLKISTSRPIDIMGTIFDDQDLIIPNLKSIFPELKDVRGVIVISQPESDNVKQPIPFFIFKDNNENIPIGSFGEGANHLYVILLALARCKDGLLLIDEIESGLHYSVLPDVWKLIFKTAKELNVQVFATTHSKDCVEAFAVASNDSPEDGELIRLERQGEKIVAKTIGEERLAQAINHDVEVR